MTGVRFEQTEIPRRRTSSGGEGGPYVYPPGTKRTWGDHKCQTCGRMVEPDPRNRRKGKCKCQYYQRTTTFIDVLQDDFALKLWGYRNVAWGISQRDDLRLTAASCRSDSDPLQTYEDKTILNDVAAEAQRTAGSNVKAIVGNALHRLTHQLDRGDSLGVVPDPYPDDLRAYEATIKREGIEWTEIETFRVHDDFKVGGTADRIGRDRDGRLCVWDIKTGKLFDKIGHAMQLAMYARMVRYIVATDERDETAPEVDLNVGYIIHLPAGKAHCQIIPYDIMRGWEACRVAKLVWDIRRSEAKFVLDDYPSRAQCSAGWEVDARGGR